MDGGWIKTGTQQEEQPWIVGGESPVNDINSEISANS
jgi:hypothetical protein